MAKPNIVPGSKIAHAYKEGVACPVPPATGLLLDFKGKGDSHLPG